MKRKRRKRHPVRKAVLGLLVIFFCTALGAGTVWGMKGYGMYQEALTEKPLDVRVEEVRNREDFTPYSELPQFYIKAAVSVEDHRFFDHWGVDLIAIGRAVWNDIKAMSFVEGGSTITQQLAKNLLFTQDKKMERKAAEVFAALEIESNYTKEEIFELYANTVYFGSGYYGIGEAARGYFGKSPLELTDYESAMLAGIPNAPSAYSPDTNKELASRRVNHVLKSMVRHKLITREEAGEIEKSFPFQ
ncbi:glycosyl transferase [Lactonifactor longoviformis]|uniref:Penicillin-binding protein 1A n=1 Tax=Lactonifactor longoviformis DSM 17459 TaxID=1122155 RepID=A0A1M5CJA3_9CLOT|nr:biosynthetic peptidoglycan transglycosylase [Lactonifactor longoviformis]POP31291.1 glycosyl transferase [Lactonifactor longoviformis]SHF54798.1 Transglycosylase [Lactonifactor longoviformis DSM 17459]